MNRLYLGRNDRILFTSYVYFLIDRLLHQQQTSEIFMKTSANLSIHKFFELAVAKIDTVCLKYKTNRRADVNIGNIMIFRE